MEPSKELYERTFSRLKASPELRKELLTMTEKTRKPKKYILRRLVVAAAVMALAAALAMGANAATNGELYEATIGRLVCILKLEDGTTAGIFQIEQTERGEDSITYRIVEEETAREGNTTSSDGDVTYETGVAVETDENGEIVSIQETHGQSGDSSAQQD